jgi:hypothetical protein
MPEEYLRSCRDCIDLAHDAQDPETRAGFLALAQKWVRLYIDDLAAAGGREDDAHDTRPGARAPQH